MHARILPDGLLSIRQYPLSLIKRLTQFVRKLRQMLSPSLNYWTFSGDRIGSDAPFCDRIYVLAGLPHAYDPAKVVVLAPLAGRSMPLSVGTTARRALVIGQPLVSAGLIRFKSALERDNMLSVFNNVGVVQK